MGNLTTVSNYTQVIPESTGGAGDTGYGQNIAVTEDFMAISAIRYDALGLENSGCVYLYELYKDGTPIESSLQVITPSDLQPGDLFGDPIKIVDDYLITASFTKGSGQIYIYDLSNDLSETIISSPSSTPDERFGCSFDLSEDKQYLFVGALGSDSIASSSGAVYCYSLADSGYELYTVLESPRPIPDAGFGRYVEVTSDQLIVGSQNSSTVFVFDIATLTLDDVIGLGLPKAIDGLGVPIDVYDDVMVIGARDSFRGLGCALVYQCDENSDWSFQGLVFDRSFSSSGSGISVSVDDQYIAISPKNSLSDTSEDQGLVTLYSYTDTASGLQLDYNSTFIVDNGEPGDFFGKRLTLDNGNLYSTALYDDNSNGIDSGSMYIIPLA